MREVRCQHLADSLKSGVSILADSSDTREQGCSRHIFTGSKDAPATLFQSRKSVSSA
ncbi:MAG TPA: hypothetical protein PLW02_13245 [Verrucomicrobiota bacterium]|nr:hypothetical protein [Verrucomicrobiota bacterium]